MLQKNSDGSTIYKDGTYARNNPSLHGEDSAYKFSYIVQLLNQCTFSGVELRILDVGGGAGFIAAFVCDHLIKLGFKVECHSFDLSPEMLLQQQFNNPYNSLATSDFAQITNQTYDLALLIDVIEHIPDNGRVADEVDRIAQNIIYNIPTERNLFDFLRNLYFKRRYYLTQTATLGHLHFYSSRTARQFVCEHHELVASVFPDYANHLLISEFPGYLKQRKNKLRRLELKISRFIFRYLNTFAPLLIQGSLFMLAKSRVFGK